MATRSTRRFADTRTPETVARLYANENFPLPSVMALRGLGHDVVTTADAGQAGRGTPDAEVLRFATGEGRALLTLNRRHFIRLHQADTRHAGLIVCTYDPDFAALAQRIDVAIRGAEGLAGRLIRISRAAS